MNQECLGCGSQNGLISRSTIRAGMVIYEPWCGTCIAKIETRRAAMEDHFGWDTDGQNRKRVPREVSAGEIYAALTPCTVMFTTITCSYL